MLLTEKKLKEMQEEQLKLDALVAQQNLSPEEVSRMNSEQQTLDRTLADLKAKSRESNKQALTLEVTVANRLDNLEQAVDEYMSFVYKLGLHPKPPQELSAISFLLELNGGASNPHELLVGEDLRKTIRPALVQFADMKRRERGFRDDERVKIENSLDQITMECENLEQETNTLDTQVNVRNTEAEDVRAVSGFTVIKTNLKRTYPLFWMFATGYLDNSARGSTQQRRNS
jgi:kinetochore protein NDC80